ncbi:hypothetical protein S245_030042 [Arachis hypogaea]
MTLHSLHIYPSFFLAGTLFDHFVLFEIFSTSSFFSFNLFCFCVLLAIHCILYRGNSFIFNIVITVIHPSFSVCCLLLHLVLLMITVSITSQKINKSSTLKAIFFLILLNGHGHKWRRIS